MNLAVFIGIICHYGIAHVSKDVLRGRQDTGNWHALNSFTRILLYDTSRNSSLGRDCNGTWWNRNCKCTSDHNGSLYC